MLVQTPIAKGDVVTIKLSTAEELITEIVELNDDHIVVRRPLQIVIGPDGAGLAPAGLSFDKDAFDKLDLYKQHIILMGKTAENVIKDYRAQTTSLVIA